MLKMPATTAAGSVFTDTRTDTFRPVGTWANHTARSVTHWGRSGAVISVAGELDASNARQLADYVQHYAGYCDWLVLDLHDLEFIGTSGFSALQTITGRCADAAVYCTTVPGLAVLRLLRICDPNRSLPTAESVAIALAGVPGCRKIR